MLGKRDGKTAAKSYNIKWLLLCAFFSLSQLTPCQAEPDNSGNIELSSDMIGPFVVGSPFTPAIEYPEEPKKITEASIDETGEKSDVLLPKPPPWFLTNPPRPMPPPTPEGVENKISSGNPCNNDCLPAKVKPKKVYSPDPCKNACYLKLDVCQLDSINTPRQVCNDKFMPCLRTCFKHK